MDQFSEVKITYGTDGVGYASVIGKPLGYVFTNDNGETCVRLYGQCIASKRQTRQANDISPHANPGIRRNFQV